MKILIELTEAQFKVLKNHWYINLSYGEGGSFGFDGKLLSRDLRIGKAIARKLDKVSNKPPPELSQ
jgi:hypothetical protein